MTVPIRIPDLGATVDTVTLVRWLVKEGTEVVRGQKIAEIETDKAVVELESVATGVLLKKTSFDGDDVATGKIIAYVGSPTDAIPESSDPEHLVQNQETVAQPTPSREIAKPRVTPMLRNFAKQKCVDINKVTGTGKGGIVTRQDIIDAAAQLEADR